jgi:hypothetical protein
MFKRDVTEDNRLPCRSLFARLPTYGLVSFDTHADPAITVIPRLF